MWVTSSSGMWQYLRPCKSFLLVGWKWKCTGNPSLYRLFSCNGNKSAFEGLVLAPQKERKIANTKPYSSSISSLLSVLQWTNSLLSPHVILQITGSNIHNPNRFHSSLKGTYCISWKNGEVSDIRISTVLL